MTEPAVNEDGEEVEPVEVLVQLAEDGEIEPWDIDIVSVTEEFLAALDEVGLRVSARALFYASVLLRMKSEALVEDDQEEEEPDPEEEWVGDPGTATDLPGVDPVDALEAEIDRRLERKTARGTPETLDGLIRELRERERGSWWKRSRSYDTDPSSGGGIQTVDYRADDAARGAAEPTEEEVTGRVHGEDIEETIEAVEAALSEQYSRGRPEVLFREVDDAGDSRVQTFLAVLFLADRGTVALEQDELFGDLWIKDRSAVAGADEAVAD